MEQRRFLLFIVLSLSFLILYSKYVMPLLMPPPQQKQADDNNQNDPDNAAGLAGKPLRAPLPGEVIKTAAQLQADPAQADPAQAAVAQAAPVEKPPAIVPEQNPVKRIELGSLDPESGFLARHTLTSVGGALAMSELNDPRYRELNDQSKPLKVLRGIPAVDPSLFSLATTVPQIDEQLKSAGLKTSEMSWEVLETVPAENSTVKDVLSGATFRFVSPDKTMAILKKYELKPGSTNPARAATEDERDATPAGYVLHLTVTIQNKSAEPIEARYVMEGPVGLPLENADNTRKYRDVRMGYFEEAEAAIPKNERRITSKTKTSHQIVVDDEADETETWNSAFHFIGIDCQYFAALLIPEEDQSQAPYFDSVIPQVLSKNAEAAESEIGLEFTSVDLKIPVGQEKSQSFDIYIGPKRESLLDQLGVGGASEFGTLGFIAKPMVSFLNAIHKVIPSYGIAIIILTICVRGLMFPISRKQALGAQKMKELQPKINELKKKYKNDREGMARAQMELFRDHNYHPLSGCLPMVIQLPIFISLYQAFSNSVDLRMAPFLWIDNLAAPDALIQNVFGGRDIWPFGRDFNLLPILTVVLFVAQQKMFMPKPDPSDEQAVLQYKMMSMMGIVMGFFFYKMPAGLCVYFITSTVWGLAERKLLGTMKLSDGKETDAAAAAKGSRDFESPSTKAGAGNKSKAEKAEQGAVPEKKGFMARMMEVAEQAAEQSRLEKEKGAGQGNNRLSQNGQKNKNKNKKKRR